MSKVEVECALCQSILAVDARHAGKQARCPNCGGLTVIPYPEGEVPRAVPAPDAVHDPFKETFYQEPIEEDYQPQQRQTVDRSFFDASAVPRERVYVGPDSQNLPRRASGTRIVSPGSYFFGIVSLMLSGFGFLSIFGCYCISPVMFAIGFALAGKSVGELRTLGMLTNGIFFVIWVFVIFGRFIF